MIRAAHARGKLAVVHVLELASARDALEAGADGLAHLFSDSVVDASIERALVAHGAFVVPTLVVIGMLDGFLDGSDLLNDSLLLPYLALPQQAGLHPRGIAPASDADREAWAGRIEETIRRLKSSGTAILAGTDAPNPGTVHGVSLHAELSLLVRAGLTPIEALTAATAAPANAFGLGDRGRIAPGLRADLVLVRGDPTKDIRVTRDIVGVWKLGVEADRAAYRAKLAPARAAFAALQAPGLSPISDFENDDRQPTATVGNWSRFNDRAWNGTSTSALELVDGGATGSTRSLLIRGTTVPNESQSFAGALYYPLGPVDLSAKSEIVFWAKGTGASYRLMLFGPNPMVGLATQTFSAGPEWTEIRIPLSGLGDVDPHAILSLVFAGPEEPGDFTFQIDEVRLR